MDVVGLLSGEEPFVVDTSAWWRIPDLPGALAALVQQATIEDRVLITPIVRMEILYSARTADEYSRLDSRLLLLRMLSQRPSRYRRGDERNHGSCLSAATVITACRSPMP